MTETKTISDMLVEFGDPVTYEELIERRARVEKRLCEKRGW